MYFETENLILRDMITADLDDRLKWETEDTEWQLWDAPWELEDLSQEESAGQIQELLGHLEQSIARTAAKSDADIRYSFQIVEKKSQKHIGWVSAYNIDREYNYSETKGLLAIGIDLPDTSARGKGYGKEALSAFADYLFEHGYEKLYTQTWSGNERMAHIAAAIGFTLVCRKENIRTVRGKSYDGLTFEKTRPAPAVG